MKQEKHKFDIKTHHRDGKTGKVTKVTPYRMIVSKERGTIFVRDGIEYYPDGSPVNPAAVEAKAKAQQAAAKAKAEEPKPAPGVYKEPKTLDVSKLEAGHEATDLGDLNEEQLDALTQPGADDGKKGKKK